MTEYAIGAIVGGLIGLGWSARGTAEHIYRTPYRPLPRHLTAWQALLESELPWIRQRREAERDVAVMEAYRRRMDDHHRRMDAVTGRNLPDKTTDDTYDVEEDD